MLTSYNRVSLRASVQDFVALTKPRITFTVLCTATAGAWLAPGATRPWMLAGLIFGTILIVSGANALNMYLERDTDAAMDRTKNRPLPAGRMNERVALRFGVALSVLSVPCLALALNATTALLAVLANLSYVLAYTPLKRRSHLALLVGAVPGAIPPLMGWTAKTAHIDPGGLVLFSILFLWQVPHFLAITLFRKEEYAKAGLVVLPNVLGESAAKRSIVNYTAALIAVSMLAYPVGLGGRVYLAGAFALGCGFLALGTYGMARPVGTRWARIVFAYSIVYLLALLGILIADHPGL